MGVALYRKGNTHNINGIDCEIKVVSSGIFNGTPDKGWFLSVVDINRPKMSKEAEANADLHIKLAREAISNRNVKVIILKKAKVLKGNAKIRNDAKEAGIKDFDTARIQTLKDKLRA